MKLSSIQIFWVNFSFQIGVTLTVLAHPVAKAKQDAWMSIIIAGVVSLVIAYIVIKVSQLHPNQSLVQYSQTILGKWMGRIVVIPYIILWFGLTGIGLRYAMEFIHLALFRRTPISVLMFAMLLLVVYITYSGGIRAIARCSELMGPVILLMIIVAFMLSLKNMDWQQLLPVLAEPDWPSILQGALRPIAVFGQVVAMLMLIPFMAKPEKAQSSIMWSMGFIVLIVFVTVIMILMTFGPQLSSRISFAFYDMVRLISIAEFIENVDVIMIIIWMFSVFIRISLHFFLTCYTVAQWLEIKDWRKLVWIISLAVFASSLLPQDFVTTVDFNTKYNVPFGVPINYFMVPLLLWGIGWMRLKKTCKRGSTRD